MTRWPRDGEVHAQQACTEEERCGNVVAVTYKGQLAASEFPPLGLDDRQEIGQALAGVVVVGEAVDHRDGCVFGHLFDLGVVEGPDHDPVHVTAQDHGVVNPVGSDVSRLVWEGTDAREPLFDVAHRDGEDFL